MKIIVVGCGKNGRSILSSLLKEGHDVIAIDDDAAPLTEVSNIYDVMCVCGSATDYSVLTEAGADTAELFVAVTSSDEVNMLSCFMARRMGAHHTIARIRSPQYNASGAAFLKDELELSMAVNPDMLAANELYELLKLPAAAAIETFSGRRLEMVILNLKSDSPIAGMRLIDVRHKYAGSYLIGVVQRKNEVTIPDGNFVLQAGDKIGVVAAPVDMVRLLKRLGLAVREVRNVIIIGGSRTAFYLSKRLLADGSVVKIIDIDRAICEEFASSLPEAIIINGDGAQQELLMEEGITETSAFLALTGMDEENILISYYASTKNVPVVVPKVNRDELCPIAEELGLERQISHKRIIADVLVRYARALKNSVDSSNIESLYKLMDDRAEALEFKASDAFPKLGVPLKELPLRSGILVAGIIRGRRTLIPTGDDSIQAGDRVVVLAAGAILGDLADILR